MSAGSTAEIVADADALEQRIGELAEGLADRVAEPSGAAIIGIRTRGATLALRIQNLLRESRGWDLPVGLLDITLYRDDLSRLAENPLVRSTEIEFALDGKHILLIDDVLYTGRTVRCALDQIIEFGRPRTISLGVLVDRGGRELPIQADIAAVEMDIPENQIVKVCLIDDDEREEILLVAREQLGT